MLALRTMRRTVLGLTVVGAGTLAIGAGVGSVLIGRSQAEDVEQYQLRLKVGFLRAAQHKCFQKQLHGGQWLALLFEHVQAPGQ